MQHVIAWLRIISSLAVIVLTLYFGITVLPVLHRVTRELKQGRMESQRSLEEGKLHFDEMLRAHEQEMLRLEQMLREHREALDEHERQMERLSQPQP